MTANGTRSKSVVVVTLVCVIEIGCGRTIDFASAAHHLSAPHL
jgi:hypothetical protein